MSETARIATAMVLAAGHGKRMRPLTETTPKPLLEVAGRPMLDHILDHLTRAGVGKIVVNLHHLGEAIERHLAGFEGAELVFSPEREELLETGGGVKAALPLLGPEPFYAINGDVVWLDGVVPCLQRLAASWDPERMDALLLLHPTITAFGYEGDGDFMMGPDGLLRRRIEREVAAFLFAGVQILHPRLFEGAPEGAFSLNRLYDRAIENERLYGLRHDGEWFHVGTPEALQLADELLREEIGDRPTSFQRNLAEFKER
ncbi:MAG: nucleotidyltransferase family protein [Rhodovibrionaceae bacterium]